ncbi:MAG: trimethylamine methyltransferase family protein [Rhodospirillales bacterium]|nr:MAG: trimethylamine methyltransferase family protein [Rhodospirillales bacterium]
MSGDESPPRARRSRRERLAAKTDGAPPPQMPGFDVEMPRADIGPGAAAARPQFAYLDEAGLQRLVERSFELIAQRGVDVNYPTAAASLARAGCRVDPDERRVRIPRELAEEALAAVPRRTTLYSKSGRFDLEIPRRDNTFHMRTGTGAHGFIEPGGRHRKLVLDDVATIAAVGDGLPEVGFIAHPFVNDVPEQTADLHGFAALLAGSEKHNLIQPYEAANVGFLMRLAAAAAGGEARLRQRPIASCIACSFTPLEFKRMDVEAIIEAGRYGLPIHACSLPTAGGTAPVTMPGTVLMAGAEILSMVVLTHVLAPGTPVIATPLIFALDMRTGRSLQASVEALRGACMAVQLCKRGFGLMTHSYGAGADTADACGQSQAERALIGCMVGLSGADILGGVGQLECATVFSPVQAVIDNELGAMQRAWLHTDAIDDESLAWELMLEIEQGGNFLANRHTLAHCREVFAPGAFLRLGRDAYEAAGRRTVLDNAKAILDSLLAREPPPGLPDEETVREMAGIVEAAERAILG